MKPTSWIKAAGALAALLLASAVFAAAPPRSEGNTATSSSKRASDLFAEVHQDAQRITNSADTLEEYNRDAFMIDWRVDARTLDGMRARINQVDQAVQQLRRMQQNLPQAQQTEVKEITPAAMELTNTAQTAVDYLRHNQDRTMFQPYTSYADELRSEAVRIARSTAPTGS
jgi:cell division septum initiation protein DivIVA